MDSDVFGFPSEFIMQAAFAVDGCNSTGGWARLAESAIGGRVRMSPEYRLVKSGHEGVVKR